MKPTANSIFKISIGISMLIFSLAAFNLSISKANATPPTPTQFVEEGTNQIGKYMMSLSSAKGSGDNNIWTAIIWDTETGASHVYSESVVNYSQPQFMTSGSDAR